MIYYLTLYPSVFLQQEGQTPLIAATDRDNMDVIKILLSHGADVSPKDEVCLFLFCLFCNVF